uniref:Uncharacterized protein n=1 Tax=Anguilla anguilla TaxID=7936 RepID=A0A0E9UT79_ANGAN
MELYSNVHSVLGLDIPLIFCTSQDTCTTQN